MNKTININLGGIFFHIDEDAYKKLKKYLDTIRKSLSDDPQGKDEIIKDIEYRIAEIFSEKIKDERQVIGNQDIADVIIVMGKPEQYAGDEAFFEDEDTMGYTSNKTKRKLFRDSEDKFLGGVCSGLAHYFNVDVIWIRLIWLLLMYKGVGAIIYIVLWILLPETKSTSDKLEMEGQDVNISNIERKIKEGFDEASQIVRDGIEDASQNIKKGNYDSKVKSGLQEIIGLLSKIVKGIFSVFGKFIGVLLIFTSAVTLISIVIGGFSLGSIEFLGLSKDLTSYPPFFYTSRIPNWLLTTFLFVAIGIPFVFLFKLGLKILSSNVTAFSRATNLSLLGVWLLSIMALSFAGIEYGAYSSNKFSTSNKYTIETKKQDTLNIKMLAKENFSLRRYSDNNSVFVASEEFAYRTNVRLDIRESSTDEMYLKVIKKANAITVEQAMQFTEEMDYHFEITDNNLLLDAYFLSDIEDTYTSQYIRMTLFVPKGKTIYLDKSIRYFLNDVQNTQDLRGRKMIKHHFKMIKEGLDCLDCEASHEKSKETSKTPLIKDTDANVDAKEIHENVKEKLKEKGVENIN